MNIFSVFYAIFSAFFTHVKLSIKANVYLDRVFRRVSCQNCIFYNEKYNFGIFNIIYIIYDETAAAASIIFDSSIAVVLLLPKLCSKSSNSLAQCLS